MNATELSSIARDFKISQDGETAYIKCPHPNCKENNVDVANGYEVVEYVVSHFVLHTLPTRGEELSDES